MWNKAAMDEFIDNQQAEFIALSNKIWDFAEMRFQEFRSSELLIDALDLHAAHLAVVACDDVFQSSPPVHALERGAVWLGRVAAGLLHPEL